MTCLTNVIGISERDCPCHVNKPGSWATINESKTDYYLDNYEWTRPVKGDIANDCQSGGWWDIMQDMRTDGLRDLRTHFFQEVGKYQTVSFGSIKDTIGQPKNANTNHTSLSRDIIGVRIVPAYCNGTILRINRIDLTIDVAQDYTISLYDQTLTTVLKSTTISAVSNTKTGVDVDWEINLRGDYDCFYLVYDRNGGLPYDIKIDCGCASSKPVYLNYLATKGVKSSDVAGLYQSTRDGFTYGLEVGFTFHCDYWDWLCDMDDYFWAETDFGRLFGKVYQMYASMKLNNYLANRPKMDYWSLVKREELLNLNTRIQKNLNQLIPLLASKLPNDFVDCFQCKSKHGFRRQENVQ